MKNSTISYVLSILVIFAFLVSVSSIVNAMEKTIWTCPMHAKVIKEAPGTCPLCSMKLIEKVIKVKKPSKSFAKLHKTFVTTSMELSAAFADDNLKHAKMLAKKASLALADIKSNKLKPELKKEWAEIASELRGGLKHIGMSKDLDMARAGLKHFSGGFEKLLQKFGQATDKPIVKMHCPMASENSGAKWFQYGKDVKNPYFGKSMLSCGSDKGVFEGSK